jgi:hypothetical protein
MWCKISPGEVKWSLIVTMVAYEHKARNEEKVFLFSNLEENVYL